MSSPRHRTSSRSNTFSAYVKVAVSSISNLKKRRTYVFEYADREEPRRVDVAAVCVLVGRAQFSILLLIQSVGIHGQDQLYGTYAELPVHTRPLGLPGHPVSIRVAAVGCYWRESITS